MRVISLALVFFAAPAVADTVVPTRLVRPEERLRPGDVIVTATAVPGTYDDPADVIGQEARVVLYAGRAIRLGDLREPALVARNALVELVYRRGGVAISAEGRALARGSVGERIAVLNTASRARVSGRVMADGRVLVE